MELTPAALAEAEALREAVLAELASRARLQAELLALEEENERLRNQIYERLRGGREQKSHNDAEVAILAASSFLSGANAALRSSLLAALSDKRELHVDKASPQGWERGEVEAALQLPAAQLLPPDNGLYACSYGDASPAADFLSMEDLNVYRNPLAKDVVQLSGDWKAHMQDSVTALCVDPALVEDVAEALQTNRTFMADLQPKHAQATDELLSEVLDSFGFSVGAEYPYDEEDRPTNIVFEGDPSPADAKQQERKARQREDPFEDDAAAQQQQQQRKRDENAPPAIKYATLDKLIERVTHEKHVDLNMRYVFLLTYHSFIAPSELLTKLAQRYDVPLPPNLTPGELEVFKSTKLDRIQIRVCSVLKNWLDDHWADFENSPPLKEQLRSMLHAMIEKSASALSTQLAQGLLNLLQKKEKTPMRRMITSERFPKPLISSKVTLENFNLEAASSLELARQLTLMDFDKFRSIQPRECLNQAWSKKDREVRAPNIIAMIDQFNRVCSWVQLTIIEEKDINKRAAYYKKFIKIAQRCRELNNFNSAFAIYCGLSATPVHRLKRTKELVPGRYHKMLDEFKELFKQDKNSRNFRRVLQTTLTPCIPYLGIFLSDLTFIEDGNPDEMHGMINFHKRCRLAERIRWIKQYQQEGYQLAPLPAVQEYFKSKLRIVDSETLYKKSCEVEPRMEN